MSQCTRGPGAICKESIAGVYSFAGPVCLTLYTLHATSITQRTALYILRSDIAHILLDYHKSLWITIKALTL